MRKTIAAVFLFLLLAVFGLGSYWATIAMGDATAPSGLRGLAWLVLGIVGVIGAIAGVVALRRQRD